MGCVETVDEFLALSRILDDWPLRPANLPLAVPAHRRLADALTQLSSSHARPMDIAALVRQLLRREVLRTKHPQTVSVLNHPPWPTRAQWMTAGCSVLPGMGNRWRITAEGWTPAWLPQAATSPIDLACLSGLPPARRRVDASVPADPFFPAALGGGYPTYRSPGQRQAVRAAMAMLPGATLWVGLPTSSGKAEVALAATLARTAGGGVTVLVVPTVSLALDLERRITILLADRPGMPSHYAYLGEREPEVKRSVREAVKTGRQPVVIAAPESVVSGPLRQALLAAAAQGWLRYLVIDEAQLVRQWGADFRPEFQALAGLRSSLLEACLGGGWEAFRTLLLSATFTAADLDLLRALFGRPGPIDLVAANSLRPEPAYWSAACETEPQRTERVLAAVAHLPRPLLLYTARVDDATAWEQRLRTAGYGRVAKITGRVAGEVRRDVLAGLRGDEGGTRYDLVVATSAFGLGVDLGEIRTVVHACIPETVDRFYQEVGRGGRDGDASISLVVHTPTDRQVAEQLNTTTVMRVDTAMARWRALWARAHKTEVEGRYEVDLTVYPPHVHLPSKQNEAWNVATVSMMAWAGLIELRSVGSQDRDGTSAPHQGRPRPTAEVCLRHGDLGNRAVWERAWAQVAGKLRTEDHRQLVSMQRLLDPRQSACEVLRDAYDITGLPEFGLAADGLTPIVNCGGCAGCRPRPPSVTADGLAMPLRHAPDTRSTTLRACFGSAQVLTSFYDPRRSAARELHDELDHALATVVRHGIRNLVVPREFEALATVRRGYLHVPDRYLNIERYPCRLETLPPLPTAMVLPPGGRPVLDPDWYRPASSRGPVLVLAPVTAREALPPHRPARQVLPGRRVKELCEALQ